MVDKLLGEYAILKRVKGLKSVNFKSRPSKYSIGKESFSRKDKEIDGDFLEEFKQNVIPGVITGLTPFWNDIKDRYWSEDDSLLRELVDEIKARYPKGHELQGKVIPSNVVDPMNYEDVFFNSEVVQSKRMEGGIYVFDFSKPIDKFLFYCYKNDPRVLVRDGREISKYVVGRAVYELVIPKTKILDEKNTIDKNIDAYSKLGAMSYDKQKFIAQIMKLRVNDYEHPDPDDLKVQMGRIASSKQTSKNYNGLTGQSRFLQLADMSNNDLMLNVDIDSAIDLRIITSNRNIYYLNNEILEGIDDKSKLFDYFKNDKNSEKYKDLTFLLNEKDKK